MVNSLFYWIGGLVQQRRLESDSYYNNIVLMLMGVIYQNYRKGAKFLFSKEDYFSAKFELIQLKACKCLSWQE